MNSMDSEARTLASLFDALEARLEKQYQDVRAGFPPDPADEHGTVQLQEQIVSADKRIARLIGKGKAACGMTPPELRGLASHAAPLRERIRHLQVLLERNTAHFRQLQGAALGSLQELQLGTEYLNSMRANRESQPKFIDTRE